MTAIHRVTEIPGPKSRAILERRAGAVARGLAKSTDVVIDRAEGALVYDVDGNTLIDLAGGIGMIAAGHCPPAVVAAVEAQARRLVHACALVATYEPYVELCELLNEVAPGDFAKKTLLANSGAEAVENAVKIARAATKRAGILCFEGGYHGRTLLALSLTSKYGLFKQGFGPFAPEVYRIPAPDVYRRPAGLDEEAYVDACIATLDKAMVAQIDPASLAAIIIEPVQGEAGFLPMPHRFLHRIRELCTQHGIVMIADEVQTGFGRTGTLFAVEHSGVVPDMITTAKALGAGMPISATTGRADLMDAPHVGGVGGTYGGSPVACAAAIEAIRMIRTPEFLGHARRIGEVMRRELERLQAEVPLVGDVRGVGPMLLIELVADRATRAPAAAHALAVIKRAVANGVVLIRAGLYSNCVRFMPPLTISVEQALEGLAVVGEAVRHVQENPPS
ncbi:MAG: aminotransferase class III-fold pyridoxal phosphate-dependent enzyme [Deltaproteobacteria bacterium]|nr:aminotransferase class III-fold pyridoxal phosphate-dependent enzyme [Deltaproteobacteria bacterium]MCW5803334.1 aminotransferase class III-fold pyridoxal phosphate-dependent enzyme [Deltaproteobacteria bacterium]